MVKSCAIAVLLACNLLLGAQQLRVGRAAVIITPPRGEPLAGYYATRLATGNT